MLYNLNIVPQNFTPPPMGYGPGRPVPVDLGKFPHYMLLAIKYSFFHTSYNLYIMVGGTSWSLEPDKNKDGVVILRILFNESNYNT